MFEIKNAALLQLFAEGGGAGDTPATEGEVGDNVHYAGTQKSATGSLGEPPSAAAVQTEDLEGEFAALIGKDGKYADAYRKQMQKSFNKRFAAFKDTEAKALRLDGFMKTVAMRYPEVDASDPDALEEAFLNDTRFYDDRAKTGEDAALPQAEKKDMKLERLEAETEKQKKLKAREDLAKRFRAGLAVQEIQMKKAFPNFNFAEEIKNPRMWEKLSRGESLRDAYIAIHHDELLANAVSGAKKATVSSIAHGSARVSEGAASISVPTVTRTDFSKLSRKEFMDIYNQK